MISEEKKSQLRKDIEILINQKSIDNDTNTPDYVLSKYLIDCLTILDEVKGYNKKPSQYAI